MDEFINWLVTMVCSFILGMVFHSACSHANYCSRVRTWIEGKLGLSRGE